ncbi:hypothetical protein DERP_009555 [Dermatophagoides pteronyssinus]|uniref:Uncharacterized protein n=1 Tax=Dermatophagoides pteronyssinus TaxID=6956 RepID=A0ABQ8JA68_DERPT|nr:hypothetical protein DERP_009555 [Dermatophagoides pteronyssinus]
MANIQINKSILSTGILITFINIVIQSIVNNGFLDGLKIVNSQYDKNVGWTCLPVSSSSSSKAQIITGYSCWLCRVNNKDVRNFQSCPNAIFSPPPPPITFATHGLGYSPKYYYTPSIKKPENESYKPRINQTMIDRQRIEFLGSFACDFFKLLGNSNRVCPNRPKSNNNK